jgi:hypothetical protein
MVSNASIRLSPKDNVAVVLIDIAKGQTVEPVSMPLVRTSTFTTSAWVSSSETTPSARI